jgi:hypothetical protein
MKPAYFKAYLTRLESPCECPFKSEEKSNQILPVILFHLRCLGHCFQIAPLRYWKRNGASSQCQPQACFDIYGTSKILNLSIHIKNLQSAEISSQGHGPISFLFIAASATNTSRLILSDRFVIEKQKNVCAELNLVQLLFLKGHLES